MKPSIFVTILLLLLSQSMTVYAIVYDTDIEAGAEETRNHLLNSAPVVFTGDNSSSIYRIYSPILVIENSISETKLIACGLWIQRLENMTIEHQLLVYDISLTEKAQESVHNWLQETEPVDPPEGYIIQGIITQIDHHEPYGMLETCIEVLQLKEDNSEYDWYDVTVTQRLTPGSNYTSSSWEWNWVQYTMNGSLGESNIYLSDYDQPTQEELPEGPFGFLWRILGFDLRKYLPWLFPPEPIVVGLDTSDFSLELFRVRYEAPRRYTYKNEPLEERHHYIIRTEDGKTPVFCHQTQAQYTQRDDFAQISHITQPLALGYIVKKR